MYVRSCPPLDHLDRMTDSTGLIQHAIRAERAAIPRTTTLARYGSARGCGTSNQMIACWNVSAVI
jgi:hypothetical protein